MFNKCPSCDSDLHVVPACLYCGALVGTFAYEVFLLLGVALFLFGIFIGVGLARF